MQPTERLYYVDGLRVFAFAILIAYHSSVAFFPDMKWLISSAEGSEALSLAMKYPRGWRLASIAMGPGVVCDRAIAATSERSAAES